MKIILLMGPPGSGKGTQAVRVAKKFSWHWLSTGDALREQIRQKTKLGRQLAKYCDNGLLVPDELMIDLLKEEIKHSEKPVLLLDGYPRNLAQAHTLTTLIEGSIVTRAFHLSVPREALLKRISHRAHTGGRIDDSVEKFCIRMDIYENQTRPLIVKYKKEGLYQEIDGLQTCEKVFKDICSYLS